MIPYHFHLIWMGKNFPFVNRLAVESLLQSNPGAEVTVHFADPPANPDWESLRRRVEFRPLDIGTLLHGLPEGLQSISSILKNIPTSYLAGRSNILRYLILYREGGIYLDFDTLTVKDFRGLLDCKGFLGEEAVFRCDDDRVAGRIKPEIVPLGAAFALSYYLSYWNCRLLSDSKPINAVNDALMKAWSVKKLNNAVLACEPASPFFHRVLSLIPETDPRVRFNLGPILMNRTWDMGQGDGMNRLEDKYFYLIPPSQTFRFFYGPAPELSPETYVLHWVSSNHKKLASGLTLKVLRKSPGIGMESACLYRKVASQVIAEAGI